MHLRIFIKNSDNPFPKLLMTFYYVRNLTLLIVLNLTESLFIIKGKQPCASLKSNQFDKTCFLKIKLILISANETAGRRLTFPLLKIQPFTTLHFITKFLKQYNLPSKQPHLLITILAFPVHNISHHPISTLSFYKHPL